MTFDAGLPPAPPLPGGLAQPGRGTAAREDGWLGLPDLPGYRAGRVTVKLCRAPHVAGALYLDVLLLDAHGEVEDSQSGVCSALAPEADEEALAAYVRVLAELLRPAWVEPTGLSASAAAIAFLRERPPGEETLRTAVCMLDRAWHEATVAHGLAGMLMRWLGPEDALETACAFVARLARTPTPQQDAPFAVQREHRLHGVLEALLLFVVRALGKGRARHELAAFTGAPLLPTAQILLV